VWLWNFVVDPALSHVSDRSTCGRSTDWIFAVASLDVAQIGLLRTTSVLPKRKKRKEKEKREERKERRKKERAKRLIKIRSRISCLESHRHCLMRRLDSVPAIGKARRLQNAKIFGERNSCWSVGGDEDHELAPGSRVPKLTLPNDRSRASSDHAPKSLTAQPRVASGRNRFAWAASKIVSN
jgi:hypothetical protein